MYTYTANKLPKSTIEVSVNIPWADITKEYDVAFENLRQNLTVEGFRKGKAPKAIAEKHLRKDDVYQELVRTMISRVYREIVEKENYSPIVSPKIDLSNAKENEDWTIKITIAEKPVVELGEYKKAITDAKAELKKDAIWVPGKGEEQPSEKKQEEQKQKGLNLALDALLKTAKCDIPDLIIETEMENRLSRLVDDVQKVGLNMDSYLKSKNLTIEDLRKQYTQEIESTYKIEFILAALGDKEDIKVEDEEINKLFAGIKDEKERANAQKNAYFYASILRKQKTIEFLMNL